jgi:hypothetical protein
MSSSGMLRRVAIVITDVSEEFIASIIKVTRIGEQWAKIPLSSNQNKLQNTLMMEAMSSPKRRFLQNPFVVLSKKTAFFKQLLLLRHY